MTKLISAFLGTLAVLLGTQPLLTWAASKGDATKKEVQIAKPAKGGNGTTKPNGGGSPTCTGGL